jgi:hypothetical protein
MEQKERHVEFVLTFGSGLSRHDNSNKSTYLGTNHSKSDSGFYKPYYDSGSGPTAPNSWHPDITFIVNKSYGHEHRR